MTLLNGQNHELHTKNEVQYWEKWLHRGKFKNRDFFNLFGQRLSYEFLQSESLNNDLENIFNEMISTYTHVVVWLRRYYSTIRVRNLFLFEMQSENDIKTKPDLIIRSDDHQYLLSLCKVLTVYLK